MAVCPSSATLASRKVKTIGCPRVPGHVVSLSLLTTGPILPLGRTHPFPFVFPAGFPLHWTDTYQKRDRTRVFFFFTLNFSRGRLSKQLAAGFVLQKTGFTRNFEARNIHALMNLLYAKKLYSFPHYKTLHQNYESFAKMLANSSNRYYRII